MFVDMTTKPGKIFQDIFWKISRVMKVKKDSGSLNQAKIQIEETESLSLAIISK